MFAPTLSCALLLGASSLPTSAGAPAAEVAGAPWASSDESEQSASASQVLVDALYPARDPDYELRYYSLRLRGESELPAMFRAVGSLGPDAAVLHGPVSAPSHPSRGFVVVRVPSATEDRMLVRALAEGGGRPERVHCALLRWRDPEFPVGGLVASRSARTLEGYRQRMLDLHGDVRWYEAIGPYTLHFFEPGEVDGAMLCERIRRSVNSDRRALFAVEVVRDRVVWPLVGAPSARVLRHLQRELSKLPGIASFALDVEAEEIQLELELGALPASDPAGSFAAFLALEMDQTAAQDAPAIPLSRAEDAVPDLRPSYPTSQLRALLRECELLAPAALPAGEGGQRR